MTEIIKWTCPFNNITEVNESQDKQCGVTPLFYWAKSIEKKNWEKIGVDIITWEKLYNRSSNHR